MAAPQWKGGKCKSIQQVKAFFRHNDEERRKEVQHTNPHIDKSLTHLNFSYKGLTYEQRCAAYETRMSEIDQGKQSSGKNARTLMQSIILYPPAGLVADKKRLRAWFMRAGAVAEKRFGSNMIDMVVDFDEVHQYRDKNGVLRFSLEHGHLWAVPEVDGKLNGKQFSSRAAIKAFNAELQAMSISEFGCPMMDGSKAKGGKSVEELKAASVIAEAEAEAEAIREAAEALRRATEAKAGEIMAEAEKARQEAAEALREALKVLDGLSQEAYDKGFREFLAGHVANKTTGRTAQDFIDQWAGVYHKEQKDRLEAMLPQPPKSHKRAGKVKPQPPAQSEAAAPRPQPAKAPQPDAAAQARIAQTLASLGYQAPTVTEDERQR